ncbi:MAG: RNA polymerase sigma factor [Actinomycetota bacterium]|nr:RNA polymerase sigma factor [Actinomycetota bacterium]
MNDTGDLDDDKEQERRLVQAARSDSEAFAQLYRHYLPKIHAFAYRRSRSREVAEDITAATFEKAYRQLQKFEWKAGGFGPWLYRIASNELADHYRRVGRAKSDRGQKAMGALHTAYSEDDVEHVEGGEEDREVVLAAMTKLNPRYQEAISLRYLAGLSHEDAAEAMGSSKPVMAVTLSRALKALKKEIDKMGTEEVS